MSAETLRKAADAIREVAQKAAEQSQTQTRTEGVWLNSRFYMTWDPAVALAVADLLSVWVDHDLLLSSGSLSDEKAAILAVANAYLGADA